MRAQQFVVHVLLQELIWQQTYLKNIHKPDLVRLKPDSSVSSHSHTETRTHKVSPTLLTLDSTQHNRAARARNSQTSVANGKDDLYSFLTERQGCSTVFITG
jgi:hypothetical protein